MTLETGRQLSHYTLRGLLGAGGMGEVYRAHDARLGRDVAVKVLPSHLGDQDTEARFLREARAVASLSHPNILAIHDFGAEGGLLFAVTELLEGETLRDRLRRGPLPPRQVARLGAAIAAGLAAAHTRGVVHRDLKPGNVFLTRDGRVKILDFGLAVVAGEEDTLSFAARAPAAGPRGPTPPPSRVAHVAGTAGYVAPEQARGERTDERADLFSLGCVLYEMLTAKSPFQRSNPYLTLLAVLRDEPEDLPPETPPALARIVRRCLEKDPSHRFQSAHDVSLVLEALSGEGSAARAMTLPAEPATTAPVRAGGRRRTAATVATALLLAAGAFLLGRFAGGPRAEAPWAVRPLTFTGRDGAPAASPDGRLVAFASDRDGTSRIWLHQTADGSETPLTAGPDDHPRFTPDGAAVVFTRTEGLRSALYRVPTLGGEPRRLLDDATDGDPSPDGASLAFVRWVSDGERTDSIVGVADADGSGAREVARLAGRTAAQPRWSPDGRRVAVAETGETHEVAVLVVDVATGDVRTLDPPAGTGLVSAGVWRADGAAYVYALADTVTPRHGGTSRVVEEGLDGRARTLFWHPALVPVLDRLPGGGLVLASRRPGLSLAETPLAAPAAATTGAATPRWLTRGAASDRQPVYSPDGAWIAFSSNRGGNLDLWAVETATGSLRRLTDDATEDWDPAWTRDGRILWSSRRSGAFEVWTAEGDGSRPRQVTRDGVHAENPSASPDGAWIVYSSRNPAHPGLHRVPLAGGAPRRIVPGIARLPEVSPDGRWVAYLGDVRLDRLTIRVASAEDGAAHPFELAIPAAGGRLRWLPDGSGLAYTAPGPDGRLAVWARPLADGDARLLAALPADVAVDSFALSPDGRRLAFADRQETSTLMLAEPRE